MNAEDKAQYEAMKEYNDNNDMPDGAFYAYAEEVYGWDIDDWVWFAEMQKQDKDYN